MWHRQFESMGTLWQLTVDGEAVDSAVEQEIYTQTDAFDQQFSRFIETSEANAWRNSAAGEYNVSPILAGLLSFAQNLKQKTYGAFDPAIGGLLEASGYDPEYSFTPNQEKLAAWKVPQWKITDQKLRIDGPVVFDVGGFGKGYWIDTLSQILRAAGYQHFLVDGGGDMFGTTKQDGSPWKVAIEKPGDPQMAIAIVELQNQGLAISDIFRRQWANGDWHHTQSPTHKKPQSTIIGCSVLAKNALIADGLTTALALIDEQDREALTTFYNASFLIMTDRQQLITSKKWNKETL